MRLLAFAAVFAMAASGATAQDAAPANCGSMIVNADGTVAAPVSSDPARLDLARGVVNAFVLDALSVVLKHKTDAMVDKIAANPKNAPFDARKRALVTQKLDEMVTQMRNSMGEVYAASYACAMTQPQLQATLDFFHTPAGHKFTEELIQTFKSADFDNPNAPAPPFDMSLFTSEEVSAMRDYMQSDTGLAFHAAFDDGGVFAKWANTELERVRPIVIKHLAAETEAYMKKEGIVL